MKKSNFKKIALTAAFVVAASSLTFAAEPAEADTYEEEKPAVTSTEGDTYEDEASTTANGSTSKTAGKKKKEWNPFEGMFSSKQSKYIFYDSTPLSTGTIGFGIKARTGELFVDPKTGKVGIQVYYQSSFFDFMFDEKNIALIAEGFEKYLADFESHSLIKNHTMKTRRMYTAKGKCRVEWGTTKIMINNFGDAQFHVGYEFKKNSPYFCIIVKDAKNIAPDLGSNVAEKSVEVQLYFTKAQAKQFLQLAGRERVQQELRKVEEAFSPDLKESDQY